MKQRANGWLAVLLLAVLPLGCAGGGSSPTRPVDADTWVAFEVHRSGLETTDAFYANLHGDVVNGLVAVGRNGCGVSYPRDHSGALLLLGTESDLLCGSSATQGIYAGGVMEGDRAVFGLYGDDLGWHPIAHDVTGNFTGMERYTVCTDAGWILLYTGDPAHFVPLHEALGQRYNAICASRLVDGRLIVVGDEGAIQFREGPAQDFADQTVAGAPDFVAVAEGTDPATSLWTAYVVGGDAIWQYSGVGTWDIVYDSDGIPLHDIDNDGVGVPTAVGDGGLVVTLEPGGWTEAYVEPAVDLVAVASFNGKTHVLGPHGEVWRERFGAWVNLQHDAHGSWSDFHVSGSGLAYTVNGNRILRWDNPDWEVFATWEMGHELTAVHVIDETRVWALGTMADGLDHFVLFYDGSDWSIRKQASLDGFTALWCDDSGDNVFVADAAGGVWWRHDGLWDLELDLGFGNAIHDIDGTVPGNLRAVGAGGRILKRGPSGWAPEASGVTVDLHAVRGPVAVGDSGTILVEKGGVWAPVEVEPSGSFHDVWYGGASDIWVVGKDATVVHYDGTAWTWLRTHLPGIHFESVIGFGAGDVWIGATDGWLLRNP